MKATAAKLLRRTLYFLLLTIGVLVILGSIILSQLDLDDFRQQLEIELSSALEQPVSIGRSKLAFNNGLAVRFQDLQIGPQNALLADIPELTATLKLKPLLDGQILLDRVEVEQPQLQFWFPILNRPAKGTTHRLTDRFGIRLLTIKDANVRLYQRQENGSRELLHLDRLQIGLSGWQPGHTAELTIAGQLRQTGKPAEFMLHFDLPASSDPNAWRQQQYSHLLQIDNLRTPTSKLLQKTLPEQLDLELSIDGSPAAGARLHASALGSGSKESLLQLQGVWQSSTEQDTLRELDGELLGLPLAGEFLWLRQAEMQLLAGRFGANNVAMTPQLLKRWQIPQAEQLLAGNLDRLELVLEKSWPAGQPLDSLPRIGAELTIADLEWAGNGIQRIQDFSAELSLEDQQLSIKDGFLVAAEQPLAFSGRIEQLFSKPQLALDVELQAELKQLTDQLELPAGWTCSGPLPAKLALRGPLREPNFSLTANLNRTNLLFGKLFRKGNQQPGSLQLEGLLKAEQLQLDRLDLQLADLQLSGSGNVARDPARQSFRFELEPLQLEALQSYSPLLKQLRLRGSLQPILKRSADGLQATLQLRDVGAHFNHIVGDLGDANGEIRIGRSGLAFDDLQAKLGKSTFQLSGRLNDWHKPQLELALHSDRVRPHDLIFRNQQLHLYDLDGKLQINADGIRFDQVKVRVEQDTAVVVDGLLDNFHDPQVRLEIEAEKANVDHVIQLFLGPQKVAPRHHDKPPRPLLIRAHVKQGSIGDLRFSNATGQIRDYAGVFTIYPLHFNSGQGATSARVEFDSTRGHGVLKVSGHAEGIDATMLHQDLFKERGLINGALDSDFYLEGELRGGFWQHAVGGIHLKIGKGTLRKFRGLARVFSLLNVSQLFTGKLPDMDKEGMPFSLLEGTVRIADGRAYTEDMRVTSEAMNLSLVGSQNLIDGTVDYQLGVMPLRTVDKVISSIPVAGWVLAGDDKALLTAYFKIEGPGDEPKVSAIPVNTVSETVFGIFKRTIGLPGKLVKDIGSLFKGKPEKKKEPTE